MRIRSVFVLVGALVVAACGATGDTAEVASDATVRREAGADVRVINGCRIEPRTNCIGVDLSGADLSNIDLQNAVFTRTIMRNVNLQGTDLRNADLNSAILTGADLTGADLRFVILRNAVLAGATGWETANRWFVEYDNTIMPDGSIRN